MSQSNQNKPDATLGEILLRRLEQQPEAEACSLVGREGEVTRVTVRALLERAMAFAELYGRPASERKIIGICLYHGLDLHAAFLGGLLAGHIPTMLAPPSPRMEATKYTNSFCRMLGHIRPSHVVVDDMTSEKLDKLALREFPDSILINPAHVSATGSFVPGAGDADEVALLQHSSGTTGLQKGVALSHRAIINHNHAYAERLKLTPDDRIVSWLPLYHDMGLIACFILPLLHGIPFVELSPFDWVLRPVSLLEQIHHHRATVCFLPNFAFSFMAESIRPSQVPPDLDLSTIRAWVNCSEPVYHSAHLAFSKRFGDCGVRWDQFTASYAMAENVFAVSQSLPGRYSALSVNRRIFTQEHRIELDESGGAFKIVSNGKAIDGTEVAVLDEKQCLLSEDRVGELAIRGDFRFSGYFRRDDLTQDALTGDGWYLTGDLGFKHEDEIYVTGRKKDLMIIQGRNFYPADVEKIVADVEGVSPGRVVVFGLANEKIGTEGVVVLAEAVEYQGEEGKRLALRVRNTIAQELDCTPHDVRIVPPRWLIKSTAGKLARNDNRNKYLEILLQEDRTSPAYV